MPYADREKQKAYQREWKARRRADWFRGKECARCGSTEGLELDHVDPRQKVNHKVWSWSSEKRGAELAKCQALCGPCHKAKTKEQLHITNGYTPRLHGERRTYNAGCRCPLCREAQRKYQEGRRARVRE